MSIFRRIAGTAVMPQESASGVQQHGRHTFRLPAFWCDQPPCSAQLPVRLQSGLPSQETHRLRFPLSVRTAAAMMADAFKAFQYIYRIYDNQIIALSFEFGNSGLDVRF